jgi:hypothetical protein
MATVAANITRRKEQAMKLQKALAVIGAGVLLFAATDAATYAATGSSLVLGKINQANAVTTIQNTGTGNALRLLTKSTATAPLVVNGKGKVTNLYADRSASSDNASKLGGLTVTQVRSGVDAAKLGGQTIIQVRTGIDAATVGGKTVAQIVASGNSSPPNVIWVAASGGQFTSVNAALAAIGATLPGADAGHRYVIKIAPGVYTETSVRVRAYVDIEGSGQDVTTITCACGGNNEDSSSSSLWTSSDHDAEVRNLTIANTGGGAYAIGIYSTLSSRVSFDHVTVTASGGTTANYAMENWYTSPTLTNVTAIATGTGSANDYALYDVTDSSTAVNKVAATATGTSGTTNYAVYTLTGTPGVNTILNDITATASGGTTNAGIHNNSVNLTIRNSNVDGPVSGGPTWIYNSVLSSNPGVSPSLHCAGTFIAGTVTPACT